MSNSKTTAPKRASSKAAPAPNNSPATRPGASGNPQQAQRARGPSTVDETIAKAQEGRVNVAPAKAVEMAGQLYSRGQYAQAERVCSQIISSRPANADAHNIHGVSLAALGRREDGIAALKRAIKLNGNAASYHANLGEILRQAGRLDEAAEAIERAIELDPNNAWAYAVRGNAHYLQEEWTDALADFRCACELKRKEDYSHLFIWLVQTRLGETQAANKELIAYLAGSEDAPPGAWVSTVAGHLLGDVSETDLFAAAKSPNSKKERGQLREAWFYAGMKKLLSGDKVAGMEHLRKCLATQETTFSEYEYAEAELKRLDH